MDKGEQAAEFMRGGLNCAQAVVKAFGPELGAPEDAAVRMMAPFGGGMGRNGLVCGAVSGALLVLGARFGFTDPAEPGARDRAYAKANALIAQFQKEHGSAMCRELLAIDPKDPKEWDRAREEGAFKNRCPLFVQSAARLAEALLREEK